MRHEPGDIIRLQSGLHAMIIGYEVGREWDFSHYRICFLHDGSSTLYNDRFVHMTAALVQKVKK